MEKRPILPLTDQEEVPTPPVPNRAHTEMSIPDMLGHDVDADEIKLPPHTTPDPESLLEDSPLPQVANTYYNGGEGATLGNFVADMSDDITANGIE